MINMSPFRNVFTCHEIVTQYFIYFIAFLYIYFIMMRTLLYSRLMWTYFREMVQYFIPSVNRSIALNRNMFVP